MVDLPRYVKPQRKPNGREFYYYERYRSTPRAWPRVPLGTLPHDPLFWVRCEICTGLGAERSEDGWRWIWRAPSCKAYPLPTPSAEDFWLEIERAIEADHRASTKDSRTFGALIDLYRDHAAYTDLAPATKGAYDRYLGRIGERWGDQPVTSLTTMGAQAEIGAQQETPRAAEFFRMVLSRLIDFGIPRGFSDTNPAEKTEKPRYKAEPYKPWPDWAFELFFEHTRVGLHMPVYSALYTGQRSVDVIPMMRPRREASAIELVARKTGANVYVPIHSDFRTILDVTHVDHVRLHLREDGAAWTLAAYITAWQRELTFGHAAAKSQAEADEERATNPEKAQAMDRLRAAGLVFHGYRKNAVNMLLEVGCTEAEVSAIVEMTEAMVRHYSKDVNKRRLAVAGIRKLEGNLSHRLNLFGSAVSPLLRDKK